MHETEQPPPVRCPRCGSTRITADRCEVCGAATADARPRGEAPATAAGLGALAGPTRTPKQPPPMPIRRASGPTAHRRDRPEVSMIPVALGAAGVAVLIVVGLVLWLPSPTPEPANGPIPEVTATDTGTPSPRPAGSPPGAVPGSLAPGRVGTAPPPELVEALERLRGQLPDGPPGEPTGQSGALPFDPAVARSNVERLQALAALVQSREAAGLPPPTPEEIAEALGVPLPPGPLPGQTGGPLPGLEAPGGIAPPSPRP